MLRGTVLAFLILAATGIPGAAAAVDAFPWTDACSYPPDVPTDLQPEANRLLGATVLLVPWSHLTDGGNVWIFNNAGPQVNFRPDPLNPGVTTPICPASLFYNEESADMTNGRTGFMVGPNLVASALHGPNTSAPGFAVIFGYSGGLLNSSCSFNTSRFIPKSQVATAVPGGVFINKYSQGSDVAIWQVTGVPAGTPWLRLRNNSGPALEDELASAGNPYSVYTKFQYGITYAGPVGTFGSYDPDTPMFFHFEVADGSSGSPFYNLDKGYVEAVTASPVQGSGVQYGPWSGGTCRYMESEYDPNPPFDPIVQGRPVPSVINTGLIEAIAAPLTASLYSWPTPEARVLPLDDVTYVLPVGGVAAPASTTYAYRTSANGPSQVFTVASVVQPPAGQPALLSNGTNLPYVGNVAGASQVSMTVSASVPATLACGTYDRYLEVDSQGFTDRVLHRFEVGLKEVSVTPSDLWVVNDLGSPYTQTRTYTIRNVRPTAASVSLNPGVYGSSTSLLTINGGGVTTLNLGAAGTPTDTQTFVVGINQNSDSLTAGTVYHGFVSVNQLDTVCGKPPIFLDVDFKRGEQQFVSPNAPGLLPAPTGGNTFGTPKAFDFDLSSETNYCISDVNLDLGLNLALNPTLPPSLVQIELTAPSGRTGILWDRTAAPNGNYWLSDLVDGFGTTPWQLFHLDDSVSPPLGPRLLSYFNGSRVTGTWHVNVKSSSTSIIVAGPARLDFTKGLCIGP